MHNYMLAKQENVKEFNQLLQAQLYGKLASIVANDTRRARAVKHGQTNNTVTLETYLQELLHCIC